MKDINTLSGVEFENLCQVLLQKAGFDVETTKASGDGGIDLIAHCHKPFFDGKYIIQCKRYIGSVGEPIVRDLYGVVMAERANKGILLTTGHYTISAIHFAEDKNLELIDGDYLVRLLSEYELTEDSKTIQYNHFTTHDCFDTPKYFFYKDMIAKNNCSFEMGHDFLFDFMFGYMKSAGKNKKLNAMLQAGFSEEYLNLFDWYAKKYFKQGKDNSRLFLHYVRKYKGLAQLLNYDLFSYVQERYAILTSICPMEINIRTKSALDKATLDVINTGGKGADSIMRDLVESGKVKLRFPEQSENFYELMNLLSIFSFFKIHTGIEAINKVLYGKHPHFKPWIEMQKDYQNALNNVRIFYFENECIEGAVKLDSYYTQSMETHREKIQDEVDQIGKLIKALF